MRVMCTGDIDEPLGEDASNHSGSDWDGMYRKNAQTTATGVAVDTT